MKTKHIEEIMDPYQVTIDEVDSHKINFQKDKKYL